jgi:hypothetical protein
MSKLLCFVFPIALQFSKKGYDVQLFVLHMKICRIISYCMHLPSLIFWSECSIAFGRNYSKHLDSTMYWKWCGTSSLLCDTDFLWWATVFHLSFLIEQAGMQPEDRSKLSLQGCFCLLDERFFTQLWWSEPLTTVHSRVELLVKSFVLTDLTSVHLYWSHWKLVGGPKLANKSLWVPCISWVW